MVSLRIGDRTGGYSVHRLVLEAFVGPMPEAMETRHLDGNPANNCLDNLRYGTRAENEADKRLHAKPRKRHLPAPCPCSFVL